MFRGSELLKAAGCDLHFHAAAALLTRRLATVNHLFLSCLVLRSVSTRSGDDIRLYWAFGGRAGTRGRAVMWSSCRIELGCASSCRAPVAPDLIAIYFVSSAREGVATTLVPHVCKRCVVAASVAAWRKLHTGPEVVMSSSTSFSRLLSIDMHMGCRFICRCRLLVRLRIRCFGRSCRGRSRELTAGVVCVRMRTTCGERRPAYDAPEYTLGGRSRACGGGGLRASELSLLLSD